jgi:hypothetical protein
MKLVWRLNGYEEKAYFSFGVYLYIVNIEYCYCGIRTGKFTNPHFDQEAAKVNIFFA